MVELKYCNLYETQYGARTIFSDAFETSNWPPDDANFHHIVSDCGFTNSHSYIVDHDLAHCFLAEKMWDAPSPVLWSAAHGLHLERTASLFEERWVYHWQRFSQGLINPLEPEWTTWL